MKKTALPFLLLIVAFLPSCFTDKSTTPVPREAGEEISTSDTDNNQDKGAKTKKTETFKLFIEDVPTMQPDLGEKGIPLTDDLIATLPKDLLSFEPHVDVSYSALMRCSLNNQSALVLRLTIFDSKEIEAYQDEEKYYLVLLDKDYSPIAAEQVQSENKTTEDYLISVGSHEMEEISISWKKLNFQDGKINVLESDSKYFDGSQDSFEQAIEFKDELLNTDSIEAV